MSGNETTSALWNAEFDRMREDVFHWTNNEIVLEYLYRQVSGENVHWLPWLMNSYFHNSHFKRGLSIGCGDGVHEAEIMRSGRVDHITGIDVSEGALNRARVNMLESGIPSDRFHFEVHDANRITLQGKFDIIFNIHSAHHVTNLEGLFDFVVSHLCDNGVYVFVEFVGPTQFQWTEQQLSIINSIVANLSPGLRNPNHAGTALRPSIEAMNAFDPSESVRSAELLTVLPQFFDYELFRAQNGAVLHQIYPLLNGSRANRNDEAFDNVIRLVIEFEKLLTSNGILSPDFVFAICRPKQTLQRGISKNSNIHLLSELLHSPCSVNTTSLPLTFSQCGEDIIIESIFRGFLRYDDHRMESLRYLDIGGGFPIDLSNTYLFYRKYGASGYVFEPIPELVEAFRRVRPRDTIVQGVVSAQEIDEVEFFVCDTQDLSSVKKEHVASFGFLGHSLKTNSLICRNYSISAVISMFGSKTCDLMSIDAEGLDEEIIRAIPFEAWRPKVIMFEKDCHYKGNSYTRLLALLEGFEYAFVAETAVNVILVDKHACI